MRFEAERSDSGAAVLLALLVVGVVSDRSLHLPEVEVSDAVGADDGYVVGDGSGVDEVVSDDVTRSPVVAGN